MNIYGGCVAHCLAWLVPSHRRMEKQASFLLRKMSDRSPAITAAQRRGPGQVTVTTWWGRRPRAQGLCRAASGAGRFPCRTRGATGQCRDWVRSLGVILLCFAPPRGMRNFPAQGSILTPSSDSEYSDKSVHIPHQVQSLLPAPSRAHSPALTRSA